jgi:hypothetical protein
MDSVDQRAENAGALIMEGIAPSMAVRNGERTEGVCNYV